MSVINTNLKALAAQGSLGKVEKSLATSMERLSTGLRINSAKDDAAGLAITNRMTAQVRGYAVAIRNSNDGISMAQTAEGAMNEVNSMLQRMRELAVQAGNGAMSDADRSNLQQEVAQLKAQIDEVANKTNHNNIKLLDGSAGKIVLQTGTNAGDTMTIGFGSVKTKDIGEGAKASLTSSNLTTTALTAGDLLINGVEVGASFAGDDNLSSASASGSAIAKVAAINRVADQTGVFATVGKTVVAGAAMTAAATPGTLPINAVSTSTIYTTSDAEVSRQAVADAINNISAQTGVKAINTGDDNQGITLVAEDGRNIEIGALSGLTAAATGVGGGGATTVGNFSLNSRDGSAIVIGSKVGGTIASAGLTAGSYAADSAQSTTEARSAAAIGSTTGVLSGNTLVINDIAIDAALAIDDDASSVDKKSSAIAIAAAINKKSELTGVTAKANANVIKGDGTFTAAAVTNIYLNGVTIAAGFTTSTTRDAILDKFNEYTGQTGVTAVADGDGIALVAEDGRNIALGTDSAAVTTGLGLNGSSAVGTVAAAKVSFAGVTMSSDTAFNVARGSSSTSTAFDDLGFQVGTFGGSTDVVKIADVDISTTAGATRAIKAIDDALNTVAEMQAKSGAYQNRLDAVVSNLTESNQNMSAARSRIQDTDYATETTNLAKSQIIQQAATAMLAQANQSSQTVLSLLK